VVRCSCTCTSKPCRKNTWGVEVKLHEFVNFDTGYKRRTNIEILTKMSVGSLSGDVTSHYFLLLWTL